MGMPKVTLLISSRILDGFNGYSGAVCSQALVARGLDVLRIVLAYREKTQRAAGTVVWVRWLVVGTAGKAVLLGVEVAVIRFTY